MAIKRRKNKLQDLAASGIVTNRVSGSIPFEYEGPNSPLFTISEIPPSVPQGKSSFLIAGTELLKNSIEVKIEIIDSEGGVIYTEPVANYLEGNARRVSIEVYDDTPPGPANLYVLAQVDPEEWEDETGTDVTNFPSPRPLRAKGKRRKKRRRDREKRKQMRGMPRFDVPRRGGGGRFFVNPNFRPPPGNDTRFRRRRGRRRRGTTSDISDQYNFIQKVQMQIVPTATNTEKILFYQEPRLRVFEAFKPFVSNIAPSASITSTGFGITGTVIQDTQGSAAASSLDTFGAAINTFRKKRKFRKFAVKGGLSKRKRITRRASPEVDNYSLNVGNNFNFTSEHVGADLTLTSISVDQNEFPASRFKADSSGTEVANSTASFEVRKVKNSFTIIPDKSFQLFDNQLSQLVDAPLTNASFSLEFPNPVTQSISITNFRSYADVRVSNIRTFSGDVFRAKIYRKSEESISDYELFADLPLESSELLLNKNEGTGLERTGYFVTQSDAVDYWEVSQSYQGLTGLAATASAKYDIDKIMDAIHISGSNYEENDFVKFTLKKSHSFILEKDVDYDFSAEIYGIAKPKIVTPEEGPAVTKSMAEMEVFISGSNIPAQQGNEPFGAKIGALRINDGSLEKDFGIVTGDFESTANSSNCIITFKVNAGQFYLSDLSIRPATETGFSPDLFTFQAPMPENEQRPETYEFLAEFYDVNNNQADAFAFTPSGSVFQGSNMVIGGGDNVMESNLFIGGETTASGMHLGGVKSTVPEQGGVSGAEGSAFMRSVGYTGFTSASVAGKGGKPGFMFYSGSILPSSGDNYKGVGLELVGESGSLRFGTNPSRFEVKADAFFVGRRHQDSSTGIGQFISGALGNVEISSSNFHLTRAGDVTMQGTITATAGAIGGFGISAQTISSSNNNLILRSTGEITGSEVLFTGGKIASFEISDSVLKNGNNFFISGSATGNKFFISSSNFNVKASGDVTGSNVLFEGGTIGGLTIAGDNLSAGTSYKISSSQDVNDDVSFISSSEFKVSADGRITGSQVKFDGGTIAGWNINSDNLQGGSLILSKDGSMRSSNYVTDFSGWIISAEDNGFAEFENVKVRGTLATTTFEKETVNAVGGQLFVANSTTITGSAVGASDTTMSVENMSGFANGEVLIAKKVTNTGFTTEYIKVNSASFDGDVSKDEFYGRIMVDRGIGQSPPAGTDSGSVGDTPGAGVAYEPGQVLASTGKIGTGYIRINANPNNSATPYIDIVERTGSGPYDVELKARLGDLSGVAGTRNVPLNFDGFGLMSEVAFLSGSQIKLEAPAFILGDQNKTFVSGSEGNIEISSSAFHLKQDGQLLFGDKAGNKYIEWDNSNLVVRGDLSVDNIQTPAQIENSPSTLANASASITSQGFAKFASASIAGFEISPTEIASSNQNIRMKAAGNMTASAVDVKGDIKANTGFLQDISVSGVRIPPENETTELRHDFSQAASAENFGPRSSSLGNVHDDVATGRPYAVENWWSGDDTTAQGGDGTTRLIPNTTGRPHEDFSNWGWKFKLCRYTNKSIAGAIGSDSNANDPGWELLESVQQSGAYKWSELNDLGFSLSWGHTLASPGYDGPKDEAGNTVSSVGIAYYPQDRYPGPTDSAVWNKSTGVSNVNHRIPPIVGGTATSLFDPESRFVGFDNYPQNSFNIHPDSGSSNFSPVFCFYTGSGLISTYLDQDGGNQIIANGDLGTGGTTHDAIHHCTFISPMIEQQEFLSDGATIELHGAPLIKYTGVSNVSTMTRDQYERYIATSEVTFEMLIVERIYTGSGYTAHKRGIVSKPLLPNSYQYSDGDTADHWSGQTSGHLFFGWTKLSMDLTEILKTEFTSNSNRFQIVINFSFEFDKGPMQDAGYAWDNLPNGLKGFAMSELRITKNVNTSTSWEIANVKGANSVSAGNSIHLGTDDSSGFNFRAYYSTKGNPSTSKYFNITSGGSSTTIGSENMVAGSSTGQVYHNDVARILFSPNGNPDLGSYRWSLSAIQNSGMIRWQGPHTHTNPSSVNDYLTFITADYPVYVNSAKGATYVNAQMADLDFIASGDGERFLLNVDASTDRVGIKTEEPAYVLDVTGAIRATANITAYSDIRIKENIRPIEDALFKVTQLEGVTYDRKDEDEIEDINGKQMGLIAQQVEPIVPEVVEIDKEGMYNLSYGNLAGLFVESIKELKQEVDDLKKEIQELKNGNSK